MTVATDLASSTGCLRRYFLRIGGFSQVLWQRVADPTGDETVPGGERLPVDASTIGLWRMNETTAAADAVDASGNGHTGARTGNDSAPVAGKFGGARDVSAYNGSDEQHFKCTYHADFEPTSFTIAAWVYVPDLDQRSLHGLILGKHESGTSYSYALQLSDYGIGGSGVAVRASVRCDTSDPGTEYVAHDNTQILGVGWHMVGMTYCETAHEVRAYGNGELHDTTACGSDPVRYHASNHYDMFIGGGYAWGTIDGYIDDIAFYDEAKSADWFTSYGRDGLNCLRPPSSEISFGLDLATLESRASSMEIEIDDIDDPDDPGKSYFGKVFAPARWTSSTAKVTYVKREALSDTQLDADANTIPVVKTDDFDNMDDSGEAYVAGECFAYTGKSTQVTNTTNGYPLETLGTFTGCTRGLYPAFVNPRGGSTETWARTLEYSTTPAMETGGVGGCQPLSDVQFSWVGRPVGLYVTTYDYDNAQWYSSEDAVLVWPGRIADSIVYRPGSGTWVLTCDSILGDLDRKLCSHLPEVDLQLINLNGPLGNKFIATVHETASDVESLLHYREVDVPVGYYTRGGLQKEIVNQLNDVWTLRADGTTSALTFAWTIYDTDGKTCLRAENENQGSETTTLRIRFWPTLPQHLANTTAAYDDDGIASLGPYPCHALLALGFRTDGSYEMSIPDDAGGMELIAPHEGYHSYQPLHYNFNGAQMFVREHGADYLWETQGDYESAGGSAWAVVTSEDAHRQPGDDARRAFVAYTTRALASQTVLPTASHSRSGTELTLATLQHQPLGVGMSSHIGDTTLQQCWQPKAIDASYAPIGPFRQLLPSLLSTGTTDYNRANWDNAPPQLSCNFPQGLLDLASFKRADSAVVAAYPELARRPISFWTNAVSWREAFQREARLFGYALAFDGGLIRCKPIFGADVFDSTVTLDESNSTSPDDFPEIAMSVGTVLNQWTCNINHPVNGGDPQKIVISDRVSIDNLDGIVQTAEIDHPGVQALGDLRLPAATAELYTLLSQRMPLLRYPSQRITRTMAATLMRKVFIGDIVSVVYTGGFQDPIGTGDRDINTKGLVLDVSWNYDTGEGTADILLYSRYDIAEATPWAPAALVNISAADAGYDQSNGRLTLMPHAFGVSATDNHDGEAFDVDGYKAIIVERAPSNAEAVTPISVTVAASAYDTDNKWLYIDEDIGGSFDTSGETEYVVLFADWGTVVTAQESLGTWQANTVSHLLNSADSAQRYG